MFDSFPVKLLVLSQLSFLVFLNVVDKFAVRIVAGVEMGTVAVALVGVLGDDGSEMFFVAERVSFGFLALISGTVIAVLNVFLFFEFLKGKSFLVGFELFEVVLDADIVFVLEKGGGAEERFDDDFVLFFLGG